MPTSSESELTGRTAVITGGAGGIGTAIAAAMLRAGADVALLDRDEARLAEAVQRHAFPERCHPVVVDITDPAAVDAAMNAVVGRSGRLDVLVNNAGISPKRDGRRLDAVDTPPEVWREVIDCNLNSVFYCSVAAARHMRERDGGTIVNVSSLVRSTWTGNASAAYTASKAGVDGLTRALAMELIDDGIRVNAVAPGRVRTPMTAAASADTWARAVGEIPIGRAADPDEIAASVLFLATDRSSFCVGTTLDVSGGRSVV
ncbi:MAG TPA: SDR family oxidoreductase [Streptosporangiales bacterium]